MTSVCRPFRITKVNLIPSIINERVQFFLPRFDFSIFDKSLTCLIADAPLRVAVSLVVSRTRCHVALGEKDDFSSSIWRRCETTAIRTGHGGRVRRSRSKCYAISRGKVHFGHLAARCTAPTIVPSVSTVLARSASHTLLHTLHLNKAIGPHSSPVTFS